MREEVRKATAAFKRVRNHLEAADEARALNEGQTADHETRRALQSIADTLEHALAALSALTEGEAERG